MIWTDSVGGSLPHASGAGAEGRPILPNPDVARRLLRRPGQIPMFLLERNATTDRIVQDICGEELLLKKEV